MPPKPVAATPILAFNDPWHDSSFCFADGTDVTHIESERFTRRKYECINPMVVFSELFPERIDAFPSIAVQVNAEMVDFMTKLARARRSGRPEEAPPIPFVDRWLLRRNPDVDGRAQAPAARRLLARLLDPAVTLYLCGHHAAHAANAYFSTDFEDALVVTLDGGGKDFPARADGRWVWTEQEFLELGEAGMRRIYGSVYRGRGNRVELLHQLDEFSIGEIWNLVLPELLQLKHGEEGTAMAMAALGDPARFAAEFAREVASYPEHEFLDEARRAEVAEWLAGLRAQVHEAQDRYDIAAAMQLETEARVRRFLDRFIGPDDRNLCLSGGTFLNCQLTGKLAGWYPQLENIYIPPAPYDGGLSIGAAQMVHHETFGRSERWLREGVGPYALGRRYGRAEVLAAIAAHGVDWREADDAEFARLVGEGGIVGLFQGSAESGRRALGNRSIIAHPGFPGLKDRINAVIKRRQSFRPFAPMVLAEAADAWFECPRGFASPYMSFAIRARPRAAEAIPNVLHLDGTARVQTVDRRTSPDMHRLLTAWQAHSGLPVLLNTSFNDNEPIVESPADALNTFMRTPLDAIYFADHGILVAREGGGGHTSD